MVVYMYGIILVKIAWLGSWNNFKQKISSSFYRNTVSQKKGYNGPVHLTQFIKKAKISISYQMCLRYVRDWYLNCFNELGNTKNIEGLGKHEMHPPELWLEHGLGNTKNIGILEQSYVWEMAQICPKHILYLEKEEMTKFSASTNISIIYWNCRNF